MIKNEAMATGRRRTSSSPGRMSFNRFLELQIKKKYENVVRKNNEQIALAEAKKRREEEEMEKERAKRMKQNWVLHKSNKLMLAKEGKKDERIDTEAKKKLQELAELVVLFEK